MVTPIEMKQEKVWSDFERGSCEDGMKADQLNQLAVRAVSCPVQLAERASWTAHSVQLACSASWVCLVQLTHWASLDTSFGPNRPLDRWHWKANSKLYLVSKDELNQTMGRYSSIAKHLMYLCTPAPQKVRMNKLTACFVL
ncbi:hypothetical protein DY000_02017071 [Brassica cretica]|uniref:Uncharacterized protein n=1 Tax=Brassica cretica TaxID=69181 RepID=A0ABQ7CYS5_BRACR|nr:hypothetical protein DY000_02017071 [Brassica cretica]